MKIVQSRRLVMLVAFLVAALAACSQGDDSIRIDGSSIQATEDSYQRMLEAMPQFGRQQVQVAILQLNMEVTGNANQTMSDPGLQKSSAARIRERINGMNAKEIIAAAEEAAKANDGSSQARAKS